MEAVSILPFSPSHKEAFRLLNEAWLEQYFEIEAIDREVLGKPREYILDKDGHILVAVTSAETVIGTVALIRKGDTYEISKLAVDEAYQGAGLGRKLVQAALDLMRAEGCSHTYLLTSSRLGPANALYRKMGFIEKQPSPQDKALYKRCDLRYEYIFA